MSAVRELVQDGVNGFLVSRGSPDEIADVILKLISDDTLREQLAENGFEMSKKFAWSDISKSIIDTYAKLMSDRRPAR
jgi:glycosyltransferase involved in cell wall biosynthesis